MVSYPTRNHFNRDVLKDNTCSGSAQSWKNKNQEHEATEEEEGLILLKLVTYSTD